LSTYKNILLYLSKDNQCEERIDSAFHIAKKYQSFIQVIYVNSPFHVPHQHRSNLFLREMQKISDNHQEEIRKKFEIRAKRNGISFHWLNIEKHVKSIIYKYAYMCDIAILSQHNFKNPENELRRDLFDSILTHTDCQGVFVPRDGNLKGAEKHIVIAWHNAKESSRALKHSMNMLRGANKVTLLRISHKKKNDNSSILRAKRFLEMHGVKVEVEHICINKYKIGKEILKEAERINATSLVMGVYSKSIWHEMLLGSTSRYIISHAKIPVFASH